MLADITLPPRIDTLESALFIQPHPDDNEIGAGGTMLRLAAQGCKVYALTVTDGRLGSDGSIPPERMAEIRRREAENAIAAVGAQDLGWLGFEDQTSAGEEEIAQAVARVIDEVKPQGIFTVDKDLSLERHKDHLKVGRAVLSAVELAQHKASVMGLYFTDRPNTVLDITPYHQQKMRAIQCHHSQVNAEFLEFLDAYFAANAKPYAFAHSEKLRVFSVIHTHCWNVPFTLSQY